MARAGDSFRIEILPLLGMSMYTFPQHSNGYGNAHERWGAVTGQLNFEEWCELTNVTIAEGRILSLLSADKTLVDGACKVVAGVVPHHYASPDRVAHILEKLGKSKAAAYV